MNVAASSAAGVNHTNISTTSSGTYTTTAISIKTTATASTQLTNSLTSAQINDGLKRVQNFYNINHRLPNYVSFGTTKVPIAQFQQIMAKNGQFISGLSWAQINDGYSRVQNFYNINHRVPNYVSYGIKKVPISQFQGIIAIAGLKINLGLIVGKPIYITSDYINNTSIDNARINSIVNGLKLLGLNAYNMGLGPNSHVQVLQSSQVPKNALIVDLYGGADAGTLYEMGTSWYKSLKGTRSVFSVFWPPAKVITGLSFLARAYDDNYDPASFIGLANPDQYLLKNGYNYMYSGNINNIVNGIFYQSTH